MPENEEESFHKDCLERGENLDNNEDAERSQAKVGTLRVSVMAPKPPNIDEHCHKDCRDEVERINTPGTPDQPQDKQENPVKAVLQKKDNKKRKRQAGAELCQAQ